MVHKIMNGRGGLEPMQWIDGAADDATRATRNAANPSQSENETWPYGAENKFFYVPESYIMYLSDFCRFLLCACG